MPAPTTADEFLDLLDKSKLVEEARFRALAQRLRAEGLPPDPTKLAQQLVREAVLTYFQAEQLLQGKYKRFTLGKYKVLEKLGSGGMGTVFLCEHKLMRRRVAVKVLPIPKAEDEASLKRFYREAKAAAAVDHPNVVRAYDIDQDENLHFIVMEWVDGVNLQDLVKKSGPLDVTRACHYIYAAAVGLQHAHEIGLLHRDIKPGNILVDRAGVVKVLDLGLARLTNDLDDNLTRQNDENVLGTADYLAPEQAMDSHTVDVRADIYSLGVTFYFLLTGTPPFPEGSVAQKLIWHQSRMPRPVKALRPDLPDDVAAVVERMMAKEPADRYQTPAGVMAALAARVAEPIPPPADREMPVLSPAVIGGRVGGTPAPASGAPTLAAGYPRPGASSGPLTLSTAATVITTGATPTPAPAPAGAAAVWAGLDTQSEGGGATLPGERIEVPPAAEGRPSRARRRAAPEGGKAKVVLALAGGALLLAAAGVGVYFAFFAGTPDAPATAGPAPVNRRVTVSKAGGEHTVPTLREALNKVNPGGTIVLAEPHLAEPTLRLDRARHKDVTIESAAGGPPAVIEFVAPPGAKGGAMVEATRVDGFRLRNVELDGKGQAEYGVQINGNAAGAGLEGVTVRNVSAAGVRLWNAAGEPGRPVVLDRVRVLLPATAEAGVLAFASGDLDSRFVAVRNGRFEGPGKAGVRFDGPATEFEVTNCRFYNLGAAGVSFTRPTARPSKLTVANNTFYQVPAGLHFEAPPPELGAYAVKASLNYFAKTQNLLAAAGPVPGLTATDNVHDPECGAGNPPLPAARLESPRLPDPNPNDDAAFLRFRGNAPAAGPHRVGAN